MRDVILFSGGLDSLCTAQRLPDATLLYVDMRFEYADKELLAAYELAHRMNRTLRVVGLPVATFSADVYVPARNLTLVWAVAATLREPVRVWIGGLKDDVALDKNDEAYTVMSMALSYLCGFRVEVASLWSLHTKTDMLREFVASPTFAQLLPHSVSCYAGGSAGCGDCPSCFRKAVALEAAGFEGVDGLFAQNPFDSPTAERYYQKMTHASSYDVGRVDDTLRVLRARWSQT